MSSSFTLLPVDVLCRVATFNPSSALSRTCWLAWEALGLRHITYTMNRGTHARMVDLLWGDERPRTMHINFNLASQSYLLGSTASILPRCPNVRVVHLDFTGCRFAYDVVYPIIAVLPSSVVELSLGLDGNAIGCMELITQGLIVATPNLRILRLSLRDNPLDQFALMHVLRDRMRLQLLEVRIASGATQIISLHNDNNNNNNNNNQRRPRSRHHPADRDIVYHHGLTPFSTPPSTAISVGCMPRSGIQPAPFGHRATPTWTGHWRAQPLGGVWRQYTHWWGWAPA